MKGDAGERFHLPIMLRLSMAFNQDYAPHKHVSLLGFDAIKLMEPINQERWSNRCEGS